MIEFLFLIPVWGATLDFAYVWGVTRHERDIVRKAKQKYNSAPRAYRLGV